METTKPLWMSRTVWMGFLTALIALLSAFGVVLPPFFTETILNEVVTGVLGLLTIFFRHTAETKTTVAPTIAIT